MPAAGTWRAVLQVCSPFLSAPAEPPPGVTAEGLVAEAVRLGLAPALAGRVPARWLELLPGLAAPLRRIRQGAVAQALMVDRVRRNVLVLAEEAGVKVAVLKGAFTEPALHGGSGLRVITDVDLLCSADGARMLHETLARHGYRRFGDARPASTADAFEWTYQPPGGGPVLVDLHRQPCEPAYFRLDLDGWLTRTRPWPTARGPIPGLCAEDMLMSVAVHAASHGFELDLRTFHDVALLAAGPGVDLGGVVTQARAAGAEVPVWLTLRILVDLFGYVGAEDAAEALAPSWMRQSYLRARIPWVEGRMANWERNNRARIILGIFPLLSGPDRAAGFLRTYARRRVRDLLALK
ncbi:MAG: nucleotidyltransferase family protein [Myxococcota bacterium]